MLRGLVLFLLILGISSPAWAKDSRFFSEKMGKTEAAAKLDQIYTDLNKAMTEEMFSYYDERQTLVTYMQSKYIQHPRRLQTVHAVRGTVERERERGDAETIRLYAIAAEDFMAATANLSDAEKNLAREIWTAHVFESYKRVRQFFVLEKKYLEGYKKIVFFLLKRAGAFSFVDGQVQFMNVGDRQYFSKIREVMGKINQKQEVLMKTQALEAR